MKQEFKMTEEQKQMILNASKPVTYMVFGGAEPSSPQENANRAWSNLAKEIGFDLFSVEPSPKGDEYFLATPVNP